MENISSVNGLNKKCGFCGEEIRADSRRCPYCGSLLEVKFDEISIFDANKEAEQVPQGTSDTGITEAPAAGADGGENEETEKIEAPGAVTAARTYYKRPAGTGKRPLSNGMKVFLTTLSAVVPGLGQLIGVICAIVFVNSEEDADRRSFGVALLVASVVLFMLSFFCFFLMVLAFSSGNI